MLLLSQGVLSRGRANSLKDIPLLECDLLLHEAGAPPIHTPISVLQELPEKVRERLYIVHTSALPPDCGLRVAPTGTANTIRLDRRRGGKSGRLLSVGSDNRNGGDSGEASSSQTSLKNTSTSNAFDVASLDDGGHPSLSVVGPYSGPTLGDLAKAGAGSKLPPLVFLRPTCVSDAWFILNLLSAVPFFSRYVCLRGSAGRDSQWQCSHGLFLLSAFRMSTLWRSLRLHKWSYFAQTRSSCLWQNDPSFFVWSGKGRL